MKSISVSDLKNQLSARMKDIRAGERLLVTDRNKPVAVMAPLEGPTGEEWIQSLLSDGVIKPPEAPLDTKAFLSLPRSQCKASLSAVIVEERENR